MKRRWRTLVREIKASLTPADVAATIIEYITKEKTRFMVDSPAGVLLDDYRVDCPSGTVISLIFTRFYRRVASFVTVVVTINNLLGVTVVHVSTGGHKSFDGETDLGASESFIKKVERALENHILPDYTEMK